jgi:predicted nucleic acid-binding protein
VTFFIDANVVIYAATESRRRGACLALLRAVAEGRAEGRTSTACLEEVWFLETAGRIAGLEGLTGWAYETLRPLLPVTDAVFRAALSLRVAGLGTNDRLHAATCAAHGIATIVSGDAGFDAVAGLRRVDPLDDADVLELTGSV